MLLCILIFAINLAELHNNEYVLLALVAGAQFQLPIELLNSH